MKTLIKVSCLATCLSLPIYGQQGDKKDPSTQKDPIPADKIPPAPFLDAEAAMDSFQLADGFSLENIAEDNVNQPVGLLFDADGRAWVVEMTNYMLDVAATDENKPAACPFTPRILATKSSPTKQSHRQAREYKNKEYIQST